MSKSKYATVIGTLPRLKNINAETTDYQDKVEDCKRKILSPLNEGEAEYSDDMDLATVAEEIRSDIDAVVHVLTRLARGRRQASLFARIYGHIRGLKDTLEQAEKDVNLLLEAYSQLLVDQYEVEATTSLKMHDGSSVRIQYEPYAVVKDREKFRLWCVRNGFEKSLSLPWQTTNAEVKSRLIDGEPEPDGVEAFTKTKIVYTKG